MLLSAAVGQLAQDIQRATNNRLREVDKIRRATDTTLGTFVSRRISAARQQKIDVRRYMADLCDDVNSLRLAAAKEIARYEKARRPATRQLRASLRHQAEKLCYETSEFVAALSEANHKQAKHQREALAAKLRSLQSNVEAFRRRMRKDHAVVRADHQKAHRTWSAFAANHAMPEPKSKNGKRRAKASKAASKKTILRAAKVSARS